MSILKESFMEHLCSCGQNEIQDWVFYVQFLYHEYLPGLQGLTAGVTSLF